MEIYKSEHYSVLDAFTILFNLFQTPFFRLPQTAAEQKKDALCFQTLAPMTVISW